ncbi:MAG: pilus assembly protein TadG-related protein [Dermatophilaceae bacterium]
MRTRFVRKHPRDEQGAVAILTALLMVVLLLSAAIVVDLGNARDVRRQSQNAADAASLAGANMLYPASGECTDGTLTSGEVPCTKDAVDEVRSYASKNFQVDPATGWGTCSATLPADYAPKPGTLSPGTPCISFSPVASPTKVRVYMPTRSVATFFGGVIGQSSIAVSSWAEASLGDAVRCSLCFLGPVDAGNGDFSVTGGSIAVNGNVDLGPNSVWDADTLSVVGTVSGGNPLNLTPAFTTIPSFGDPLLNRLTLPLDVPSDLTAKTDPCSATTGGPGLYAGPVSIGNNDTCTLTAGLYVISNTWDLGNNSLLRDLGAGVTLYVKNPGLLNLKNGDTKITAATTGITKGYVIIYDRDNVNDLAIQGNGGTLIAGTVYAPASRLYSNGTSTFGFSGGPFVFGSGYTNGNGSGVRITDAPNIVSRALMHLSQ